jgi:hypothetical protein
VADSPSGGKGNDATYAYRPSVMGPIRAFNLSDDGIDWDAGVRSGHIPYRNIRRLRLSYRPTSMQSHRFVTEVWAEGAAKLEIISTSCKSMFEQERLDQSYSDFVRALHHRISDAPTSTRFEQGSSPFVYWPGLLVFACVALGLAGLIIRALQNGSLSGAVLVVAFLAMFIWYGGNFLRRNRPGKYRPDVLPKELIPL